MMRVTVHRASPLRDEVVDGHVEISREIGESRPADMFERDARKIAAVLFATLPGGTVDCLLAELMRRKRSQLIVAYGQLPTRGEAPRCACGGRLVRAADLSDHPGVVRCDECGRVQTT